jgi:hypothetical protein
VSRKQFVTLMVGVALFTSPGWLPHLGLLPERAPNANQSRFIGWEAAEAGDDIARDIFERVNDERSARGLPPLAWHDGLAERARTWSERMIDVGYEHSTPEFRDHPDFVGTGENILAGYGGASDAHVGWMRSEGHRENILRPEYDAIGIGVVCRNDGRMWATQIFGVSDPAPPGPAVDSGPNPIVRQDPGSVCPTFGSQLDPW